MYCKNCGSLIDDQAVVCPKCGVTTGVRATPTAQHTNTLSIVGFVLSFFVAIAGLVCSIIARKQIRETNENGMGLATAGMVISIVSIVLAVVAVIVYVAVLGAVFNSIYGV